MPRFPLSKNLRYLGYSLAWCMITLLTLGYPHRAMAAEKISEKQIQATVNKIIQGSMAGIDTVDFLIDLENHIARNPGEESWLEAAGILQFRAGRFDQARRSLLKLRKPSEAANRLIAISLFETKEYRKALRYPSHSFKASVLDPHMARA